MRKVLSLALILSTLPTVAGAQAWTPAPGQSVDPHRYQADQHRQAMQQLRNQADQREAMARQLDTETRLNRLKIEAARQPAPFVSAPRTLDTPEQERIRREAATARRQSTAAGVGEIDGWLDRRPNPVP
ncbi:hypothetical protein ACIQC9_10930 [Brevundimonas sp. NPDC092305]|uniref:hypothetical protein n=1 Tax=Brevundimonas sp. NPDC092305 TaxID=3363957 RepID=UPI0038018EE8